MLTTILERMRGIREGRVDVETDAGLCYNVAKAYPIDPDMRLRVKIWLAQQFPRWSEFTGHTNYPVPHPEMSPCAAYDYCTQDTCDAWDRDTEYGAARYRLLDFLIERAEAELKAGGDAIDFVLAA